MKSLFAVGVLAASFMLSMTGQAAVSTSEGRVQEATVVSVDPSRTSNYSTATTGSGMPSIADTEKNQNNKKQAAGATSSSSAASSRDKSITLSNRASLFRIYDAGITLLSDRDGDGYHSDFKLRFDADSFGGDALVYAKLYIRRVGDTGDWQFYHATDDFWIYGTSGTDDYYVETNLTSGFPTADYDVLIDLYESGYSGVVATIGPYDDASLAYVPLEETGLDVPVQISGYHINNIVTSLITDADHDGFYSKFRVTFDPDTDVGVSYAYAVLWVRPQGGAWIKEHTSGNFPVDPSGTADAYSFTAEWINGYPTARYDVQIDLYDAATGLLAATAGSEWSELSRLPLEDQAHDVYINPPTSGGGIAHTTSDEHGGGAMLWSWLLPLLALAMAKKRER